MDADLWEAILYDWHNRHRLHSQRNDIGYWTGLTDSRDRLLVLGAGTGRIAVPLARCRRRSVTAVDVSLARLTRMPWAPGLTPVCADMRRLPLRSGFDAVVIPYSTLQLLLSPQDRLRALREVARVILPGGSVHIDVSGSFDGRAEADWYMVLSEPCSEVGAKVEEWERRCRMPDHILIEKSFHSGGRVLAEVHERWAYLDTLGVEEVLSAAGFDLFHVDQGYGGGASPHRRVYHGRRKR